LTIIPHRENSLEKYFDSIRRFPLLSAEEERTCARKWKSDGDPTALQRLVEGNLRYVVKEARHFRGMGLELIDLISEGNLGLIKAAERFDPDRETRFLTYASWWIRQSIFHALAEAGPKVRLPQKLASRIYHLGRTVRRLEQSLGYAPSVEEIADASMLSAPEVERMLVLQKTLSYVSTDQVLKGTDTPLGETLERDVEPSAMETLEHEATLNRLKFGLATLSDKERRILELHYGLNGNKPMTLEEVGQALDPPISREHVRQLERQAFSKIRKNTHGLLQSLLDGGEG
jgi:RNA polymerase primary sigma factor